MNEVVTFGASFDPSGMESGVARARANLASLTNESRLQQQAFQRTANTTVDASKAFNRLAQDVRLAQMDFKAGKISATDFSTAIQVAQTQALNLRARGIVPAAKDMANLNLVMQATAGHATMGGHGLGSMTRDLGMLTASTMGANIHLGKLGAGLATLGFGTLASFGLFAGLAAITIGFDKLTEGARKAKDRIDELVDAAKNLKFPGEEMGTLLTQRGETHADLIAAQQHLADIQAGKPGAAGMDDYGTAVRKATAEVDRLTQAYNRFDRKVKEGKADEALKQSIEQFGDVVKETIDQADLETSRLFASRDALTKMRPQFAGPSAWIWERAVKELTGPSPTQAIREKRLEGAPLMDFLQGPGKTTDSAVKDFIKQQSDLMKAREEEARRIQQTKEAIVSSVGSMVGSLLTASDSFKDFGRSVLNMLGQILGQSIAQSGARAIGFLPAESKASGGVVGDRSAVRWVSPTVFRGAPHFQSGGIVGDEVPIIAHRGEVVLPRGARSGLNVTVNAPQQYMTMDSRGMRELLWEHRGTMAAALVDVLKRSRVLQAAVGRAA